jgi:hypothetical protein
MSEPIEEVLSGRYKITAVFDKALLYRFYAKKYEIWLGHIQVQAHFQILYYGKYTDYSLE